VCFREKSHRSGCMMLALMPRMPARARTIVCYRSPLQQWEGPYMVAADRSTRT
jgi:hypothetical protein